MADNPAGNRPMMITEIEKMSEVPQYRGFHHRRAHSDTTFRCFDDLLHLDTSDFEISSLDIPTASTNPPPTLVSPMAVYSSDDSSSNNHPVPPPNVSDKSTANRKHISHLRSLSVDSDFFDGLRISSGIPGADDPFKVAGEKRGHHLRHSNSMDGMSSVPFDFEYCLGRSTSMDGVKKVTDPDRLAELSLIDPKRAKRILANRQSAARSKERKIKYTNELERKVLTLQSEATALSAQLTILQRSTTDLTIENKELKLRMEAMKQQEQLRDELHEALRQEVQRLKLAAAGQTPPLNANFSNRSLPPQSPPRRSDSHPFGSHWIQQHLQQPPQQTPQSSNNNHTHNVHPSFIDFNRNA